MAMKLSFDVSLQNRHTMGFAVKANALGEVTEDADWAELPELFSVYTPVFCLGEGANTVFMRDFPGLILHIATRGIEAEGSSHPEKIKVTAAAGENWQDFVRYCLRHGWYGLENLSLIPGTVGAAPVQNIGAYGAEVKDFIHEVECLNAKTGERFHLAASECRFAYRASIFKTPEAKDWLITRVTFHLDKTFQPNLSYAALARRVALLPDPKELTALKVAELVSEIRREKLPDVKIFPNCGSFFHNPLVGRDEWQELLSRYPHLVSFPMTEGAVKIAAGWLIDYLGLKGFRVGKMAVDAKQALVIVNLGGGTPEELRTLVTIIKNAVAHEFGLQLEVEPQLVE